MSLVFIRCHPLSFAVTSCHSHSLYHSLSFVVTCCHSLSLVMPLVVTRYILACLFINDVITILVLVGFLIFAEILKKSWVEKRISPMKWSTYLYISTLQNFAKHHFFDVNGVYIVISCERDIETGENMWKVFKMKSWA